MKKLLLSLVLLSSALLIACGGASEEPAQAVAETPPAEASAPEPAPEAEANAQSGGALNVDEQGRALRGFDAVAYHVEGQPTEGSADFSHEWSGATWLFASAENRDTFAASPETYAPQNGGYCTFGVVLRKKLDVDPQRFLVQNDDLFLFLNAEVQEKFNADLDSNLGLVASNWPDIADKHPDELDKDAS